MAGRRARGRPTDIDPSLLKIVWLQVRLVRNQRDCNVKEACQVLAERGGYVSVIGRDGMLHNRQADRDGTNRFPREIRWREPERIRQLFYRARDLLEAQPELRDEWLADMDWIEKSWDAI